MKLNPSSSLEIKVSSIFKRVFVHDKDYYAIQWRFLSFFTCVLEQILSADKYPCVFLHQTGPCVHTVICHT